MDRTNKRIIISLIIFLAAFFGIIFYLTYFQLFLAKDIKNNPSKYNSFNDVEELMADTNDIKDAVIEVHERSKDEQLRRIAELKEKAIMDEKAIYKAGRLRGEKEGIQEGLQKGITQGQLEKSIEIIKNLHSMNLTVSQIAQAVDMSETEVKKIIDENQ